MTCNILVYLIERMMFIMKEIMINDTQTTQVGGQDGYSRAYQSIFYDPQKKVIYSKSLYKRKHVTVYTSTTKQDDTIYTVAGRDPATIGRIFLLLENIDDDNMIIFYNHDKKRARPASTKKDLYNIMGFQSQTSKAAVALMKTLFDKNVIIEMSIKIKNNSTGKEEACKRYCISPIYTMALKGISLGCYKLFKESIDKLLPLAQVHELEKVLFIEKYGEDTPLPPVIDQKTDMLIEDLFKDNIQSEEEKQDIFNEYILKGQPAKTYQPEIYFDKKENKIKTKYSAHPMTLDNDTYFIVNRILNYESNESKKTYKPKKTEIKAFNSWFIDIDAGKDEEEKYFSLEEVARRKTEMMKVINLLPATAIVDTRNGYHVYFACSKLDSKEDEPTWQKLQMRLHDIIMIADNSSRTDCSRIMRLPGSTWCKKDKGLEPYSVTILQAAARDYTADDFAKMLDTCQDKVQAAAKSYVNIYPNALARVSNNKVVSAAAKGDQTERIQSIINLSTETFERSSSSTYVDNINEYLHQINLAEFLQIENPTSFVCVLHDDHSPSATIYTNETGYRYYCGSSACVGNGAGKGLDIIDVVMTLSDCTYVQAVNYLSTVYSIKQQATA